MLTEGYASLLRASAARWPERTALNFEDASWTYAELDSWVDEVAAGLHAAGLHAAGIERRVVLLADNCPEYLVVQFALARVGAAFATPNSSWTSAELRPALDLLGAEVLIGAERFADLLPRFIDINALPRIAGVTAEAADDPDRETYLPFSSGTTGTPKAVRHTSGSLCGAVAQLIDSVDLTEKDRLQLALPLCHIFGATMSGAAIAAGAELTLFRRFDLDTCLAHVVRSGVTVLPIGGTVAYSLANRADLGPLPSLRLFMWGGSPVPPSLAKTITERTGVGFLCSYGMTEAMMVAFNPVRRRENWRLDSPGYPTLGTSVRVAADGQLEVSGPSVAAGYVGLEGPWTADGWFRTGDVGRIEADGRIQIVDRAKDMLKVSGFAVSPIEVEQALLELDGVDDCGVYGIPDDRLGELIIAAIVGTADEDALRSWSQQRLATYKQPRRFVRMDVLPRSSGGKLLRRQLSQPQSS